MVQFEYLYKGLCGMANAHKANAMAGHLGAALVAGYFFGEQNPGLHAKVYRGVEAELDRVLRGEEAIWYDARKAGLAITKLFNPLPKEKPLADGTAVIAKALSQNVGRLRQSGHNVIFASIAIRAIQDHPEFGTPTMIAGIRKLIERFDKATMGRGYYGKEKGWVTGHRVVLPRDDRMPYKNQNEMIETVTDELIRSAATRKRGFGGLWHLINHAAGLVELARLGDATLAQKGLQAHHHHMRLWRSLPDVERELGPVERADHDPRTSDFWADPLKRDDARLTHRIKTLYGYGTLRALIDDKKRQKALDERFLYLMA